MRRLTDKEILEVSGADDGTTFVSNAGSSLGGMAGAFIGGRIAGPKGAATGGAVGSGAGALIAEKVYATVRNIGRSMAEHGKRLGGMSGMDGTSFRPQTPTAS